MCLVISFLYRVLLSGDNKWDSYKIYYAKKKWINKYQLYDDWSATWTSNCVTLLIFAVYNFKQCLWHSKKYWDNSLFSFLCTIFWLKYFLALFRYNTRSWKERDSYFDLFLLRTTQKQYQKRERQTLHRISKKIYIVTICFIYKHR